MSQRYDVVAGWARRPGQMIVAKPGPVSDVPPPRDHSIRPAVLMQPPEE